jgi:hypothetical protein
MQEAAVPEDSDEEDEFVYNPLKLPLGWDGKPIPYWLYKLHGLNLEFKCEICGELACMHALISYDNGVRSVCQSSSMASPQCLHLHQVVRRTLEGEPLNATSMRPSMFLAWLRSASRMER